MHEESIPRRKAAASRKNDVDGRSSGLQVSLSQPNHNVLARARATEDPKEHELLDQPGPSPPQGPVRSDRNAQGIVDDHPLMIAGYRNPNDIPDIELLLKNIILGVDLDAGLRYPPPRCHKGTRQTLLGKVSSWIANADRDWSLLWIYGSAGVGKSALAQTIAEHCRDQLGRLGAALFISKKSGHFRPDRFFPTVAYQIATSFPPYRYLISQLLKDHPTILEQDSATQFRKLISEPFALLKTQGKLAPSMPLLIVLDGLDECGVQEAQFEFVEAIGEYVRLAKDHSLLWVICSRPESHLKTAFLKFATGSGCKKEQISVRGEGENDVFLYLQDSLSNIRDKYLYVFDPDSTILWPSNIELRTLSKAASGLFSFASSAIRSVGDSGVGDPQGQLTTFLESYESNHFAKAGENPLLPLDRDYIDILSSVPHDTLPITLRILAFCAYNPRHPLLPRELCNFLCLDPAVFLESLCEVHSVVDIPFPVPDQIDRFNLYHSSFGQFLRDPSRSGSFYSPEAKVFSDVALQSLRWLNLTTPCSRGLTAVPCFPVRTTIQLQWDPPDKSSAQREINAIGRYASAVCWKACLLAAEEDVPLIYQGLSQLHFCPSKPLAYPRDHLMVVTQRIYEWRLASHVDKTPEIGDIETTDEAQDDKPHEYKWEEKPLTERDAVALLAVFVFAIAQYIAF
ncbi:hypothetical protein P691DRAFT_773893 [Macrolepiota fuliginosa MF-IS2]|uniref:Nephrocystin 3-like N-terminal domain-containing protein n=1 Tax=Macrolepiota fuliginosa MF-IS2 TaxID=1400762 RepID=A0A9P5XJT2_9AGAR|nr:hypothetical protein P691DRAFT_773893 [Macrolepiota fuliginosa MF-IS2]